MNISFSTHELWTILAVYFVTTIVQLVLQERFPAKFGTSEQKRFTDIEKKLNRLMDALNVPLKDAPDEEVKDFLRRGMKINAIKVHREQTGMDFKDSKDAVDALEAEMKARGLI